MFADRDFLKNFKISETKWTDYRIVIEKTEMVAENKIMPIKKHEPVYIHVRVMEGTPFLQAYNELVKNFCYEVAKYMTYEEGVNNG